MIPCPACRHHVRPPTGSAPRCVFCGVLLDARVVGVLLALTTQACGEEMYGIMVTDVVVDTDVAADTGDTASE